MQGLSRIFAFPGKVCMRFIQACLGSVRVWYMFHCGLVGISQEFGNNLVKVWYEFANGLMIRSRFGIGLDGARSGSVKVW